MADTNVSDLSALMQEAVEALEKCGLDLGEIDFTSDDVEVFLHRLIGAANSKSDSDFDDDDEMSYTTDDTANPPPVTLSRAQRSEVARLKQLAREHAKRDSRPGARR